MFWGLSVQQTGIRICPEEKQVGEDMSRADKYVCVCVCMRMFLLKQYYESMCVTLHPCRNQQQQYKKETRLCYQEFWRDFQAFIILHNFIVSGCRGNQSLRPLKTIRLNRQSGVKWQIISCSLERCKVGNSAFACLHVFIHLSVSNLPKTIRDLLKLSENSVHLQLINIWI